MTNKLAISKTPGEMILPQRLDQHDLIQRVKHKQYREKYFSQYYLMRTSNVR